MALADPRQLLLHKLLRRRNSGFDLPRRIERVDPRTVELERLTPRRLPICDRLVDLREDSNGLPALALQIQDAPELRQQLHVRNGFFRNADGPVDLQTHPRELLGFGVTALLDENVGQSDNEARGGRVVLALIL